MQEVTATRDGLTTGQIAETMDFARITSSTKRHKVTLPSTNFHRVSGHVGLNGCLLVAKGDDTINGDLKSIVLPANSGFFADTLEEDKWILTYTGAAGTPYTSTTQEAIDAVVFTDRTFQFNAGPIEIKDTLDLGNTSGGKYIGHGQQQSLNPVYTSYNGASTQLWWSGDDGKPVMLVQGGEKYVADFIIHPDSHNQAQTPGNNFWTEHGNAPRCAIEMRHNASPNLGTGDFIFERITMESFAIGVLLGDYDLVREQSDESSWNNITFNKCPVGFQLDHLQVLGHAFEKILFRNGSGGCVFKVRGGGKLVADNIQLSHGGTCLYFDPANTDQFGPNTYDYRLSMVRADQAAGHTFKLFDSNPATVGSMAANIVVNGGGPQNETYAVNNARLGMLYGRQRATLRDIVQLQVGHFGWDTSASPTYIPTLTLENCVFSSATIISSADEVLATTGNSGQILFRATNCRDWAGNFLPDVPTALYNADGTKA